MKFGANPPEEAKGMATDPNAVEQAVSQTLRDSLGKIQRTAEELHQAINDLVSACASNRATHALPPMVRAQMSAASLAAGLESLARFVTSSLQPGSRSPFEQEISRATSLIAAELAGAVVQPEPELAHPIEDSTWSVPPEPSYAAPVAEVPIEELQAAPEPAAEEPEISYVAPSFEETSVAEEPSDAESAFLNVPVFVNEMLPDLESEPYVDPGATVEPHADSAAVEAEHTFRLDLLAPAEQELHRRAFRVAKVSMQDIKMLRPEDVRIGRENRDLCFRLRDDIEKAHKEYDRRFQSIYSYPVDYFYDWMVEILGGGDPQALGEYPYPSPVLRH
jgi:hypothetical protein